MNETTISQDQFIPDLKPIQLNSSIINQAMEKGKRERKWVIVYVIGTKPCFYKFYGAVYESHKQDIPFFVINSDQHYDELLTTGLKEFNFGEYVGANLGIRGDLAQKSAELFMKIGWIGRKLAKDYPDVTVVPVVLGDTILTSIVPAAWRFSRNEKAIQNEAGLRSMTATALRNMKSLSPADLVDKQFHGDWELLRNEPFPEQWDSYTSAAGSEFLVAPLEINRQHLLREGYPDENIFLTGGVVVDALALKLKEKPTESIFSHYPQLENDRWIRMDIHRRGNLTPSRFKSIIHGMKQLVEKGHKINFVEMSATRLALDSYGLRPVIEKLSENKNFLFTKVWPEYANVIEFYKNEHCLGALTDSGGVQEEMNLLNKPCMTCRFNTDRPETVKDAHSNILTPPLTPDHFTNMVDYIASNDSLLSTMAKAPKLYGEGAGKKFVSVVKDIMATRKPFYWAHEALGLSDEDESGVTYL